jgi:hypothetical protein
MWRLLRSRQGLAGKNAGQRQSPAIIPAIMNLPPSPPLPG